MKNIKYCFIGIVVALCEAIKPLIELVIIEPFNYFVEKGKNI